MGEQNRKKGIIFALSPFVKGADEREQWQQQLLELQSSRRARSSCWWHTHDRLARLFSIFGKHWTSGTPWAKASDFELKSHFSDVWLLLDFRWFDSKRALEASKQVGSSEPLRSQSSTLVVTTPPPSVGKSREREWESSLKFMKYLVTITLGARARSLKETTFRAAVIE